MRIHFLITGGTIDSEWNVLTDTVSPVAESVIPKYVNGLQLPHEISYEIVCMKDSRSLTPVDLENVAQAIVNSDASKFIVTHGTYTMPDTARYLRARVGDGKAVVLTGSMIPLTGFTMSDAGFNLDFSIRAIEALTSGVYVAMNGQLFESTEVMKVISEGAFRSVHSNPGTDS